VFARPWAVLTETSNKTIPLFMLHSITLKGRKELHTLSKILPH
jgi:hypothetical protein